MRKAVAIIPARFNATRFPGKPIANLKGKPLIQHVYERVSDARLIDSVLIATDDKRIFEAVAAFGGNVVMTSGDHASGSDRIAEAAAGIECDFVINVQGDEPFIRSEMVDDVIGLLEDEEASMTTLAKKITARDEIVSPNVVKVVVDDNGFALYFSRSPIPYYRDDWSTLDDIRESRGLGIFKHIGIYGYRKKTLLRFTAMPRGRLEIIEKLEQLRALAAGMKIKVKETEFDTFGVDTAEDLERAERALNN